MESQWVGIVDKPIPLEGPTFEETIYITPTREPPVLQAEIKTMVEQGARALGLTWGAFHAEARITSNGPVLLEIAGRPIGGVCSRLHTYCLGSDYNELIVRAALGEVVAIEPAGLTPAGVMMLPVPRPGRITRITGVDEARSIEGVRDMLIFVKPGDILRSFPEQGSCLGVILATGPTTDEVQQTLERSHAQLHFEIESGSVANFTPA
jgi:hypothetical protein